MVRQWAGTHPSKGGLSPFINGEESRFQKLGYELKKLISNIGGEKRKHLKTGIVFEKKVEIVICFHAQVLVTALFRRLE